MSLITLLTDFGSTDGFSGILRGVIWSIYPQVQIADISHEIPPQDIRKGAYTLQRAYPYFPAGTVHLAVVDPGVGTERRPLVARLGEWFFVGPDNGLFTCVYEDAETSHWTMEFIHLANSRYFLPEVSTSFHGRDIFAPAAAHLARGVSMSDLGTIIRDPVRLLLPHPVRTASGWMAHITDCDRFGNLLTDLPAARMNTPATVQLHIGNREIVGIRTSYGTAPTGELIALCNSQGLLEIAVVNGSAAQVTGGIPGMDIEVVE
jgi:S-adenosylmethionine hydrolase